MAYEPTIIIRDEFPMDEARKLWESFIRRPQQKPPVPLGRKYPLAEALARVNGKFGGALKRLDD